MRERIVVLGGSFNPATRAHLNLIETAMAAVGAQKGIFVPTPQGYVERKLKKADALHELFSEPLRLEILGTLIADNPALSIYDGELKQSRIAYTYETLCALQELYPKAELCFVIGADKLHILPQWGTMEQLLSQFKIAVAARTGENPQTMIENDARLAPFQDSFLCFETDKRFENVSSSAFCRLLMAGDERAREMVTPAAYARIEEQLRQPESRFFAIRQFNGRFAFLANAYVCPVQIDNMCYQNAWSAFCAQRYKETWAREKFQQLNAFEALKLSNETASIRPDWEDVKLDVMAAVLRAKFEQNLKLRAKLVDTGICTLVAGSKGADTFWGFDLKTGEGQNHLGKILMRLRSEWANDCPHSDTIEEFQNEYRFLSNFWQALVCFEGLTYQNNEAAFQAQKCLDDADKAEFCALDGAAAKRLGRQVALRPDWEEVKVEVMYRIVKAKFEQNEDLARKLLATGNRKIEEGNSWNDTFWGISLKTGKGENHLGRILMQVREQLAS